MRTSKMIKVLLERVEFYEANEKLAPEVTKGMSAVERNIDYRIRCLFAGVVTADLKQAIV